MYSGSTVHSISFRPKIVSMCRVERPHWEIIPLMNQSRSHSQDPRQGYPRLSRAEWAVHCRSSRSPLFRLACGFPPILCPPALPSPTIHTHACRLVNSLLNTRVHWQNLFPFSLSCKAPSLSISNGWLNQNIQHCAYCMRSESPSPKKTKKRLRQHEPSGRNTSANMAICCRLYSGHINLSYR